MIAALPMYDWPEVAWATDAFYAALRDHWRAQGLAAPPALSRAADHRRVWRSRELIFGQTCGYPYATTLRGLVRLVATPCYAAEGCEGPTYRSAVVVRRGDAARSLAELRGRRAAFNAADSLSGHVGLRAAIAELGQDPAGFFAGWTETGGHRASLEAVAEERADCAAIDCVSLALARRHTGLAAELRTVGWTPSAPALPYVTAGATDDAALARLRAGLQAALADPVVAEAREALLLVGAETLPEEAYDRALELGRQGAAPGGPEDGRAAGASR